ncbi:hypothetical protein NSTCB13_02637 [Nostoc sp. DSM 114160]|jgi:hypothetical protein
MSTSYIISQFRKPEAVKNYLDTLLTDFSKATYHWFVHVLCGTLISFSKEEDGWVPVPSKTMEKEWGKRTEIQWPQLEEAGFIEVFTLDVIETEEGERKAKTYSKRDNLCRSYRINQDILIKIAELSTIDPFNPPNFYNLVDGTTSNSVIKYKKKDENNNYIPQLLRDSMDNIKRCIINYDAIKSYISIQEAEAKLIGTEAAYRRYLNDKNCFDAICSVGANLIKLENGLAEFTPLFNTPQYPGRISETGGGLQTSSRLMKHIAFSNVPGLRNYDLKSSQVFGLIQQFEKADVDTSWLHGYLKVDKQEFADRVGISKDRWKQILCATIMGAHLKSKVSIEDFEPKYFIKKIKGELVEVKVPFTNAVIKALYEEANEVPSVAMDYYIKYYQVVEPLLTSIKAWQKWLVTDYLTDKKNLHNTQGKVVIKNPTGQTFSISDYMKAGKFINKNELLRKVSAFILQGVEASYIHHLTCLSSQFGFEVLSNQFDGLVVLGEIPVEAMQLAKAASGLTHAHLEEKGFM